MWAVMSSNFVKNARSKTAHSSSQKTWNSVSQIKPNKKKKQRRPLRKNQNSARTFNLEKNNKYTDKVFLQTFMLNDWKVGDSYVSKYWLEESILIHVCICINSTDKTDCIAFDKSNCATHIFAKFSREMACLHLATLNNTRKCLRQYTPRIIESKPE